MEQADHTPERRGREKEQTDFILGGETEKDQADHILGGEIEKDLTSYILGGETETHQEQRCTRTIHPTRDQGLRARTQGKGIHQKEQKATPKEGASTQGDQKDPGS